MDYKNTFVRIKGETHFDQVFDAYKKEGPRGFPTFGRSTAYIRCDEDNDLRTGIAVVLEEFTAGYTELILRNGQLVPADEPVKPSKDRWTRITYAEYPDGSRMITKIENCLTREECEKVAPGYLNGTPHYYLDGDTLYFTAYSAEDKMFVKIGERLPMPDNKSRTGLSGTKIDLMRRAGERFTACKKAAAEKLEPKIIEVVI